MEQQNYTWTTTFQTAENTMTHVFSDMVTVIVEFKFGIIIVIKDGEPSLLCS